MNQKVSQTGQKTSNDASHRSAASSEFWALLPQVQGLINDVFGESQEKLGKGSLVDQATELDMFAAKCAHIAEAMRILGDRAGGLASEMLES